MIHRHAKNLGKVAVALTLGVFFLGVGSKAAASPVLTGVQVGAFIPGGWFCWGSPTGCGYNLFIAEGSPSGAIVTAAPSLNLSLAPGTHTFYVFGDWDRGTSQDTAIGLDWTLRLVFDGHPLLGFIGGVAGQQDLAGFTEENEGTLFVSNTLLPAFPGSLAYSGGGFDVELVDFNLTVVDHTGIDRVSPFNVGANGRDDAVGLFTLRVTDRSALPVPEPHALWMLGIAIAGAARLRHRIQSR